MKQDNADQEGQSGSEPANDAAAERSEELEAIRYLLKSALLGPIRQLIPAALNIILVPIIIAKGGLVAVGYWGIVNLVTGAFLFADGGSAQYISRTMSNASRPEGDIRKLVETVVSTWLILTGALALITVLLSHPLLSTMQLPTGGTAVFGAVVLLFTGYFSLVASLYTFMHIAIGEIHFAQIMDVVVAVLQFVVAVVLLEFVDPFMALVIAICSRYLAQCVILQYNMLRKGVVAAPRRPVWPRLGYLLTLFKSSKGFAAVGISSQLIEITYRSSMLFFAGASALGRFEIARRGPTMVEQSFTNGMRALFALFSATDWHTSEGSNEAYRILQWTYRFLTLSSIAGLAAWICLAGPILGLWLNIRDPELVLATQLFALHNAVRMINVPTYWMAQARGAEGALGMLYTGQVCGILLCLVVASQFGPLNFLVIAIVITIMNIAIETATLVLCQFRFAYLRLVVQRLGDMAPFASAAVLVASGWLFAAPPTMRAGSVVSGLTHAAYFSPILLGCALLLFRDRVRTIYAQLVRQLS